jgi:hypothetical protein
MEGHAGAPTVGSTLLVNGDAMEAAGLRRQYSDEMVSRLREDRAA